MEPRARGRTSTAGCRPAGAATPSPPDATLKAAELAGRPEGGRSLFSAGRRARDAAAAAAAGSPAARNKGGARRPWVVKRGAERPLAAAIYWAATAAAREWSASIREHAAWTARSAAWAAKSEADEALRLAAEDGMRGDGGRGQQEDEAAAQRLADALERAADAMRRLAGVYGRTSRLVDAADSELKRACRACRRASGAGLAETMRGRAQRSRQHAQDAAVLEEASRKGVDGLLQEADDLEAAARGGRGAAPAPHAELCKDARQRSLDSAAMAEETMETKRLAARARMLAAAEAKTAADAAAATATAAAAGAGAANGARRADPDAERAAAALRRAMAAANRADAAAPQGRT